MMKIKINPAVLFGFLPLLSLITECEQQAQDTAAAPLPYTISVPGRWTVEHFSLHTAIRSRLKCN